MGRRLMLITDGAIAIVLILGAFVLLSGCASSQPSNAAASPSPTPSQSHKNAFAPYLKQYGPNIKSQIAQGLHLTPEQVATQLQSDKTLSDIATAQNISPVQLQTIITNALNSGLQPAVQAGNLTQQQVNGLVKNWLKHPKTVDSFMGAKAQHKTNVTPTATTTTQQ